MLENYQNPHLALDPASGEVTITADSEDAGSNGIVNYKADLTLRHGAGRGGFGIHMHSIGDRSTRVGLDALAAARASNGDRASPPLAHLQVVHPDDQQRLGELGSTSPSPMPGPRPSLPTTCWSPLHPANQGRPVPERGLYDPHGLSSARPLPGRAFAQGGRRVVAGSDAPVDSRDPARSRTWPPASCRRPAAATHFGQSAHSLAEMLAAYTINGARAVRQGDITGSIEAGKSADFIVLDRDLFALVKAGTPELIADTQVEQTVFMGETVYPPE
jgi:predicted amidohydrolase YtcJ